MMVLITYDVDTTTADGRKRLRLVAKHCTNYGQRVQKSVFECLLDPAQFAEFRHHLEAIIDVEKDSIRYYFLGNNWHRRVEHVGVKESYDPEGMLIT
ncbi:MAG: CRISPR-associated endonuclease Cas2 [Firmicutes bacterium]|nr:CRISPR-associated endonuclease Cas2 [Bacillota bacterium]